MRHRQRPRRVGATRALGRVLAGGLVGALTLAGCGGQQAGDLVPAGAADVTIPDDFPLSAGMGGPEDTVPTSRTGTGLRDLELCRTTPLRGLGTRDRMVADNSGGESANIRELVVLSGADEAAQVAQQISDLASECDRRSTSGDMEMVAEVHPSPFGPEPATALLQTYSVGGEPGTGVTVVHVVPAGAALLVTSTYGPWTREEAHQALDESVEPLRQTMAALAMFDDGATPSTDPTEIPTEILTEVPADFPLGAGMVEDGGDFEVSPPSTDGEGVGAVEMCGREVWPSVEPAADVARLVTSARGPEYADRRELLVHADAEQAVAAMAAIRRAAAECRSHDNQVWTVVDRDTGYDTVTMGLTYADGLGSAIFQVTRVGSARLMVHTYGEGSLASLDGQADEVTATSEKILPAMCVFTRTGC